ncbi:hypothetical protein PC123_g14785 [Phytophthora cactorum]|nr:hypothetical protein PC123_g14785 [Phytophthora cactorum]
MSNLAMTPSILQAPTSVQRKPSPILTHSQQSPRVSQPTFLAGRPRSCQEGVQPTEVEVAEKKMHHAGVVFAFAQGTATPAFSADRMVATFCFEGCCLVAAQRAA